MSVSNSTKTLSFFSLVMINVIAVDSLRSLPIGATYGFSVVTYYLIAGILFFIPSALAAAELATRWPTTGGIYIWVREAFGNKTAFIVMWLQWVYNVIWYPTISTIIAATVAYLFNPAYADDKVYMVISTLVIFWSATLLNCFGMRISSWVSTVGAIVGTLLPMAIITVLGAAWLMLGKPTELALTWSSFAPNLSNINQISFVVALVFGLIGIEMSAIHAGDVKNPKKAYPWALLISVLIILASLVFASIAIAIVLPHQKLNIITGLIEAYIAFFSAFHMTWMIPVIIIAIIISSISGVAAWIIGPSRGLMVASEDTALPKILKKVSSKGVPVNMLLLQGGIVSLLTLLFLLMPSVSASYWLLSALTAQLAVMSYLGLFAALIVLRIKHPQRPNCFCIPGGLFGVCITGGVGLFACLAVFVLGFIPPSQIETGSLFTYEALLMGGIILFTVPVYFLVRKK
ncbi:MAG: amino acid permease [Gammaproteobacteria bacterium]|nr:amino acid permease [Gammaproteobacteria bacterium]